eukprot:CAMPEP_0179202454 /NCGR_PEP_ID=MMETSP0796-20121207/100843_1 /TAXON_ID=73915 /ORGANISM="Pyrodinium bahamense, Strain pbaha01" /LENGTH=334 /DNA_ID=CAMNT_0020907175 /DNA_START=143 /DNA_END=1147 /DNA_ORIENTATION=-
MLAALGEPPGAVAARRRAEAEDRGEAGAHEHLVLVVAEAELGHGVRRRVCAAASYLEVDPSSVGVPQLSLWQLHCCLSAVLLPVSRPICGLAHVCVDARRASEGFQDLHLALAWAAPLPPGQEEPRDGIVAAARHGAEEAQELGGVAEGEVLRTAEWDLTQRLAAVQTSAVPNSDEEGREQGEYQPISPNVRVRADLLSGHLRHAHRRMPAGFSVTTKSVRPEQRASLTRIIWDTWGSTNPKTATATMISVLTNGKMASMWKGGRCNRRGSKLRTTDCTLNGTVVSKRISSRSMMKQRAAAFKMRSVVELVWDNHTTPVHNSNTATTNRASIKI